MLRHFNSIEKVMTASEEELREAPLMGAKIVERFRESVGGEHEGKFPEGSWRETSLFRLKESEPCNYPHGKKICIMLGDGKLLVSS